MTSKKKKKEQKPMKPKQEASTQLSCLDALTTVEKAEMRVISKAIVDLRSRIIKEAQALTHKGGSHANLCETVLKYESLVEDEKKIVNKSI